MQVPKVVAPHSRGTTALPWAYSDIFFLLVRSKSASWIGSALRCPHQHAGLSGRRAWPSWGCCGQTTHATDAKNCFIACKKWPTARLPQGGKGHPPEDPSARLPWAGAAWRPSRKRCRLPQASQGGGNTFQGQRQGTSKHTTSLLLQVAPQPSQDSTDAMGVRAVLPSAAQEASPRSSKPSGVTARAS
ncbi:hypothetical protein GWK47_004258 [Chionoecetes opilio]|uniref:Uncharacterized protein n=1 Tax=Chionoecetes opilio TaxID=41210 RepID=A0A8J5D1Y1_CHIOP|nr:hypothetical protein GWK47_004258 [Chionoecetes opilio]